MRQGVRSDWSTIPSSVRAAIDDIAGARVVASTNLDGGFSPGPASRCDLADGRRVFVKAAGAELNPQSPEMHRSEAVVLAALPARHPAPELIGVVDDGDWVALVIEWVEGRMPRAPLTEADWRRMLALTERLAIEGDGLRPDGMLPIAERHPGLMGHWGHLAGDRDGSVDRLDRWSRSHLTTLAALETDAPLAAAGDTLLQLDLRTDNVLFSADGDRHDVVVDWPWATIGAAWIDLLTLLPALHLDGAPPPDELFGRQRLGRDAEPDAVDAFLAAFAGFFTRLALLDPPPGLPTLREFQAAQGRIAREWLAQRLGLEHPA